MSYPVHESVKLLIPANHDFNKLVWLRRSDGSERWDLPGGRINGGEDHLDAISRKTHEELGWSVASEVDRRVLEQFLPLAHTADKPYNLQRYFYVCRKVGRVTAKSVSQHLANQTEPEHDQVKYFTLSDASERTMDRSLRSVIGLLYRSL